MHTVGQLATYSAVTVLLIKRPLQCTLNECAHKACGVSEHRRLFLASDPSREPVAVKSLVAVNSANLLHFCSRVNLPAIHHIRTARKAAENSFIVLFCATMVTFSYVLTWCT